MGSSNEVEKGAKPREMHKEDEEGERNGISERLTARQ